MDWLTFVTEMTKALSWPVVLLVILVLLRKPFNNILPFLTKVRYGVVEMEFNQEIALLSHELPPVSTDKEEQQIKERMLQTAMIDPKSAVIKAWRHVENRLVDLAQYHNLNVAHGAWAKPLILSFFMLEEGFITESQDDTIKRIKALRDQAVHSTNILLSAEEAVSYVTVAMQLAASIDHSEDKENHA